MSGLFPTLNLYDNERFSSSKNYQSTTAKENHEDNKSLKPIMFYDFVTSLPKIPPHFSFAIFYTDLAALEFPDAAWQNMQDDMANENRVTITVLHVFSRIYS